MEFEKFIATGADIEKLSAEVRAAIDAKKVPQSITFVQAVFLLAIHWNMTGVTDWSWWWLMVIPAWMVGVSLFGLMFAGAIARWLGRTQTRLP